MCVDICKRNGKTKLIWFGDKNKTLNYTPKSNEMVLTVHRWFANKSCPGSWMYSRMGELASKVTAQLGTSTGATTTSNTSTTNTKMTFKQGDVVSITGKTYYDGKSIPSWVLKKNWIVKSVNGNRVVIDKSEDGKNAICSAVKASDIKLVKSTQKEIIHTVVKGDTLWDIAKKYLGSGSRYTEIVKLNGLKSSVLYAGQKLKIPNN